MNKEISWYENYSLNLEIPTKITTIKIDEIINKLNTTKDTEKTVENKINKIEEDYHQKLQDLKLLCTNTSMIEALKTDKSLVILQKELDIIKLITKYTLQNKNLDYSFFTDCINILLTLSETLRLRLGQKEIVNDKINNMQDMSISRCSYKFCSYQDTCTYNYNLKTKNLCYQDHYVHNMVSLDLKILLNYIKTMLADKNVVHNKEILKTINTLSFVIGHMELELRTKCMYIPENEWEDCHVVKNK